MYVSPKKKSYRLNKKNSRNYKRRIINLGCMFIQKKSHIDWIKKIRSNYLKLKTKMSNRLIRFLIILGIIREE